MTAYVVHLMYSERAMASALRNYSIIQGASGSQIYKSRPRRRRFLRSCFMLVWYVLREKTSFVEHEGHRQAPDTFHQDLLIR